MSMLGFLPWLPLWHEVSVGESHFVPFVRGNEPFGADSTEQRAADMILSSYRTSANSLVSRAAVVRHGEHSPTDDLSQQEKNQVWEDAEILCVAAISCNEYFSQVGYYVNSSLFGVIFQGFSDRVPVAARRRDGYETCNSPIKLLNVTPMPGVPLADGGRFDLDRALIQALVERRTRPGWEPWEDAIRCFNLANTDSYLIRPHMEMVLMLAAIQRVIGVDKAKEGHLARQFGSILTPRNPLPVDQSRRCRANQKRKEALRTRWVRDFYNARGECAHGSLRGQNPVLWRTEEFLVLGAFIFPVIVKKRLSADGLYELTGMDRIKEDAFERLADSDIFQSTQGEGGQQWGFPWGDILGQAQLEQVTREMKEQLEAQRSTIGSGDTGRRESGPPNEA